jgi:hypothetical protein
MSARKQSVKEQQQRRGRTPAKRFYVVAIGRKIGFFNDYEAVCKQTSGYSGNYQRSFYSLEEAVDCLETHRLDPGGPWYDHRTDDTDRAELRAYIRRRGLDHRADPDYSSFAHNDTSDDERAPPPSPARFASRLEDTERALSAVTRAPTHGIAPVHDRPSPWEKAVNKDLYITQTLLDELTVELAELEDEDDDRLIVKK